jgi:cytochrome c biogenesis protein CcmG, thiol:disulfide interchange protein DsbE
MRPVGCDSVDVRPSASHPPEGQQPSSIPGEAPGTEATGAIPGPSLRRRLVFLGLGVVLAVGLGIGLFSGHSTGTKGGAPSAGDPVPAFTLARLGGGQPVHVSPSQGRPEVLLFFASWCSPCQREIPQVARLYAQEQATSSPLHRVALVGIDGDDPTGDALSFVRRSGVTFPVGVDARYAVTQGRFGFAGLPESVFVQRDGTIAGIHYGALGTSTLRQWEHRLLS